MQAVQARARVALLDPANTGFEVPYVLICYQALPSSSLRSWALLARWIDFGHLIRSKVELQKMKKEMKPVFQPTTADGCCHNQPSRRLLCSTRLPSIRRGWLGCEI